jgi:uroporphyrinogen decarboxylase
MRQAGRYLPEYRATREQAGSFLGLCYNPQLAAEVTMQPIRRYGMDAAIIFADILLIPQALGIDVKFVENEGPKLGGYSLEKLNYNEKIISPVFESLKLVRAELAQDKALIGFAGSPWTVATYIIEGGSSRDYKKTKLLAYQKPTEFAALIDAVVKATIEYLKGQIKAGANALQLFDSWAGELAEDEFEKWVIAPTRKIVEGVKAEFPNIKIIGFPRKAGVLTKNYALRAGVDAISLDQTIPLTWAKENLKLPLQGNMDPQILLCDAEVVKAEAKKITKQMQGHPFIFNLGHGLTPDIKPENVAILCDAIRN